MSQKLKDVIVLYEFLIALPSGVSISYEEFQNGTGIKVNCPSGRGKLYSAAKKANVQLLNERNIGYSIDGPNNAAEFMEDRFSRASRAIDKADNTHQTIVDKHLADMPEQLQKDMVYIGVVFAAMKRSAQYFRERDKPIVMNDKYDFHIPWEI